MQGRVADQAIGATCTDCHWLEGVFVLGLDGAKLWRSCGALHVPICWGPALPHPPHLYCLAMDMLYIVLCHGVHTLPGGVARRSAYTRVNNSRPCPKIMLRYCSSWPDAAGRYAAYLCGAPNNNCVFCPGFANCVYFVFFLP